MPKYTFECGPCALQFHRNLAMAEHPVHECPSCKGEALRQWMGQGFAFDFTVTAATPQGNSGVTKHDYPTADQAVGRSAEARWGEISEREKVKKQVREMGGHHALRRRNGRNYIEYEAGTPALVKQRKKLVDGANAAYERQAEKAR